MSKKTRKKSGEPSAVGRKAATSKASAKRATKSGRPPATKSAKNSKNRQTKALRGSAAKPSKSVAAKPNRKAAAPSALEGTKAPAFHLPRDGGNSASLSDYAGQKLVVFFYPRADTPGCTREAIAFTRLSDAFAAAGTAVIGVSGDAPKAQEAFRDKHQLSVPLISDEKHDMLRAYGAWGEKSMYGRTFEGILRTTVLIGADGRIVRVWRNVRVDGHAEEVLAAAKEA